MNATQLLAHFDRLSEAPDAVPRLRRFILDLAVRGKLVEQDLKAEPAVELLKRIQLEKVRLLKKGATRKASDAVEVSEDSRLYVIPSNWAWTNLAEIADFSAGRTPSRHETVFWNTGDYPWVSIRDMKAGETLFNTSETVSETAKLKVFGSEPVPAGTLIMSFKLTIGRISRLGMPAFHNEAIISIRPHLPSLDPYLFKALPLFAQSGNSKDAIKGATLNRESLSNIPIALPPLAEQHRIVAKVDELMALCDQLEAAQQERERRRDRLAAASLQRLNQPAADTIPEAQREHARFHLHHLPRLTSRPEHIMATRQTILNLAVSGRLVPQDAGDESARALLDRIAANVSSTATEKAGSNSRKQKTNAVDAPPYLVPVNWQWAQFSEVASIRSNLVDPKDYQEMPHIAPDNIESRTGRLRPYETVAMSGMFSAKHRFFGGCILYSKIRPALAKAVIVNFDGLCSADMYPILPLIDREYLHKYMLTDSFVMQTLKEDTRVAMPKINQAALSVIAVPVPPLAEQHRIVAKVDELMALCDQLEAQLTTTQTDSRRLLEAVLDSALA